MFRGCEVAEHEKKASTKLRLGVILWYSSDDMGKRSFIAEATLSDEQFQKTASFLYARYRKDVTAKRYASVKQVLTYVGMGATIATAFVAPNAAGAIAKMFIDTSFSHDSDRWKRFNTSYLRQSLKRLESAKFIEYGRENGQEIVKITKEGKTKVLKYAFEHLEIKKPSAWDGKWRIVIYDIPQRDKSVQWVIRDALKAMGFYQMQKSVYLCPYPCYDEVEFVRSFYNIGNMVKYLLVTKLEDDTPYREYFGV